MQPFVDGKTNAVVGMPRGTQNLDLEVAYVKGLAVCKVVVTLSKTRFPVVSDFCASESLQGGRAGHKIFVAVRFKDILDSGAFAAC